MLEGCDGLGFSLRDEERPLKAERSDSAVIERRSFYAAGAFRINVPPRDGICF